MNVAGIRSEKYFSVSATSAVRLVSEMLYREEAGYHGEPGQRDRPATIGDLEVDANGLGAAASVVATIAASVAMKPVPASPRSRWVWLIRPDAALAATPVSFMLFMAFLHHSVTGIRVLTGTRRSWPWG
ncbi:hypothetical protein AB0I52_22065 [Streptomyces sp. NPDC050423]|uniref:hypothetical protein n=1 Tax=Streptomyces sp. NPDC050423 TaxID=3155402 RepID=UPI00344770C8